MATPQTMQESRWIGRILRDKWRIDARIARGGMGTVFAATHKNNGSIAAIKILHPEFSRDADTRSRFLQEGYAANQVNHPGVVRILDDDVSEEGLAYLVMELLEGELLEQRRIRKGGTLSLAEVYELADQLLDVLAAAHAKGIVHRDIKPDNIFLTRQGRLKVLDFGFAQMKSGFRHEQTATGFLLGTPGFMAPEQAIGNRPLIDAQTDIWAVGATLFLLLTGEPVHNGDSAAEMLVAAANYPARSIATLEPGLPRKLVCAVDRALALDKGDRWPDARSMQIALRIAPGRPARLEPTPDRARRGRSIPDVSPPPTEDELGDETRMDHIPNLDDDLVSAAEATALVHPADLEPNTIEATGERAALGSRSPGADRDPTAPAKISAFETNDETVVMDWRPRPQGGAPATSGRASMSSQPEAFPPVRAPMPSYGVGGVLPTGEHSLPAFVPEPNVGDPISAGRAAHAPKRAGSKVLVLFLIGGMTMVVVILTGLLVILGLD